MNAKSALVKAVQILLAIAFFIIGIGFVMKKSYASYSPTIDETALDVIPPSTEELELPAIEYLENYFNLDFDISPLQEEIKPMNKDKNLIAFLSMIRYAEGTAGVLGYNTLFGYGKFWDMSKHPNKRVPFKNPQSGKDDFSTAAGAYQINFPTYQEFAPKLGITGFSPADQDAIAIELIRSSGALDDVYAGNFEAATRKVSGRWASLPFAKYGQPTRSLSQVAQAYVDAGGEIA